jgi:hypothetical protein
MLLLHSTKTTAVSRIFANGRNYPRVLPYTVNFVSQGSRGSREVVPQELFVAPSSKSRLVLAYVGAATQLVFWGNLAQWAGSGYAAKDKCAADFFLFSLTF